MKTSAISGFISGGLAAALWIGLSTSGPGAEAPTPPVITEAVADAQNAVLTIEGVGFRAGFPVVSLGSRELPVRWATESAAAVSLPELRPGAYRLSVRWPDGSQADFPLAIGAHFREEDGRPEPDPAAAAADTEPADPDPVGTTRYGANALANLDTGIRNTAFGLDGLFNVTTGVQNTAVGWRALTGVVTGNGNTAVGGGALQSGPGSEGASYNVAIGRVALRYSRGSHNIAIGDAAGLSNPTGSSNIYLGNRGVAGESGIVRIGTPGLHTETHLQGRVFAPGFVPTYQ